MKREANDNAQLLKITNKLIDTVKNTMLMYVNPKYDRRPGVLNAYIGKCKLATWIKNSLKISKLFSS
jgi:hypothetical protein